MRPQPTDGNKNVMSVITVRMEREGWESKKDVLVQLGDIAATECHATELIIPSHISIPLTQHIGCQGDIVQCDCCLFLIFYKLK